MQGQGFWKDNQYPALYQGGVRIYNKIMPKLVHWLTPDIPYWNCSPFGGQDLNCNEYGDRHHWNVFMNSDMNQRITPEIYDEVDCKFCSEFGCIGPVKLSSLKKYYGPGEIEVGSEVWKLHTNSNETKTVRAAIERHYHSDAGQLGLDDYLLYSGLFQGLALGYAYEAMRNAKYNNGALLWSYNDCWGEVGWSIIDYYVARKISFYFVKRALAHKRIIIRESEGNKVITCLNDNQEQLEFTLEYGYVHFNGLYDKPVKIKVVVPPLSRTVLVKEKAGQADDRNSIFYARTVEDSGLIPAFLRKKNTRELCLPEPELSIANLEVSQRDISFDVTAKHYAHGVHFNMDSEVRLSDDYFDLLPGEVRHVCAQGDKPFAADIVIHPVSVHSGMLI
jgi:beta-mannosidase